MNGATLYIMCGLPFSGKTTLARALAGQCGFVHLDLDVSARARNLFPEEGIDDDQWGPLFLEMHGQAATCLTSGKSVIFDAVNHDRAGRDRLRRIARQSDSAARVIYLALPVEVIDERRRANQVTAQRPAARDADFAALVNSFETPTIEEQILIYDGTGAPSVWIEAHIRCTPATTPDQAP